MPKRPLPLFLLCFCVVALSATVGLLAGDAWLHEPGAELFGVRPLFLVGIVAFLEAPVLAALSPRSVNPPAAFLGTVAGAPAALMAYGQLHDPGSVDLGGLVVPFFIVAGVLAVPVFVEFWVVTSLRGARGIRGA